MTAINELQRRFQQFIQSLPLSQHYVCSYFIERLSKVRSFQFTGRMSPDCLEYALSQGFRRCGNIYYQTNCSNCFLCLSYRIAPEMLELSTSQKRVLKRNQDISVSFSKPFPTMEKENLYLHYQYKQHFLKPFSRGKYRRRPFDELETLGAMYDQMYANTENSIEMELYLEDRLVGFAVFDLAVHSISAVYSVYDPNETKRSLGTYIILNSILWAKAMKYKRYYLGFYIPGHPKMDYKSRFKPAEIRHPLTGQWEDATTVVNNLVQEKLLTLTADYI
jgi:arginine-tRNA-protein transferase